MLLGTRKTIFAGMTLAVSAILLVLGGVFETSTLFFLAAGAFCIGIVIRELGIKAGAAFLAASLLLGFFIAPNKLYVLTYGLMELYLFLRELLWKVLEKWEGRKKDSSKPDGVSGDVLDAASDVTRQFQIRYTVGKFMIFQPLFLPIVVLAPELLYAGELSWYIYILMIIAGEMFWLVADIAYDVFQRQIWGRIRRQFDWTT